MSLVLNNFYSFGEFILDPEQRILVREGKPVGLAPKVFDTLLMLVENSGRIVTKEELMNRVWPDTFVEEDNLTYNIKQLRKTFGDDARNPFYIETIARRGYRFIAEVKRVETKEGRDSKLELIDNPAPQSHGEVFTSGGFPRRVDDTETQSSAGAVALADWRRKTSTSGSGGPATEVSPEPANRKVANLEIVRASTASQNKRKKYFYVLTGLVGLVILAGFGYGLYQFTRPSKNPHPSSLKVTRLTSNGKTNTAGVSPDGRFVAYVK